MWAASEKNGGLQHPLRLQLMAAYGLRPEELQHLEIQKGQLWTTYQKLSSRGRTRSRVLRLLPCDEWAKPWQLEKAFRADRMPPMRPGHGAEDLGIYMRRRPLWQQLRREYEEKSEKLVLYSCRHGYAHRLRYLRATAQGGCSSYGPLSGNPSGGLQPQVRR